MASTNTTNKAFEKQATGENANSWGDKINTVLDTIDSSFGGTRANVFASADITLTPAQAASVYQNCTGTASGNNLIVPGVGSFYLVFNNTSGSITVKTASGTGIAIASGKRAFLWCDATNVVEAFTQAASFTTVSATLTGGTIDGVVIGGTTKAAGSFTNLTVTGSFTFTTPLGVVNGGIGAATLTANNVLLGNGTSAPQAVAPGSSGNLLTSNGSTWQSTAPATNGTVTSVATGAGLSGGTITGTGTLLVDPSYFQGYIGGLTLSKSSATVIAVAAGACVSSDAATLMKLAAFTKTTGAWAVGSGNGGLDTGSIGASSWYHVYVIERTDTSVVDALISLSATAPTMPTNYTKKRRIGSFKTDGSNNILAFTQVGETFYWGASIVDVNEAASTSQTLKTMSTPLGVKTRLLANATSVGSDGYMFASPDQPNEAPSATAAPLDINVNSPGTAFPVVYTNTSSQIWYRALSGGATLRIATLGWIDDRGKFD